MAAAAAAAAAVVPNAGVPPLGLLYVCMYVFMVFLSLSIPVPKARGGDVGIFGRVAPVIFPKGSLQSFSIPLEEAL